MDRVEEGVANFRQFQSDARDFFSRHDAREQAAEETENKRHAENQTKINIILVITAIATAIIMGVGIYVTVIVSKHAKEDPINLFRSQTDEPMLVLNHRQSEYAGGEGRVHY